MKKYLKLLILLAITIVLVLAFVQFNNTQNKEDTNIQGQTQLQKASLKITSDSEFKSYDISSFIGKSALAATQAVIDVKTSGSGENAFLTSIHGREANSSKNEFWKLKINGKDAEVGSGSYIIQPNDQIEWVIDTFK